MGNKNIERIERVYKGMRERCNQKKHVSYKYYGAKGIKVLVSKKDFIKWYLERVPDNMERPNVDRIDPSGHYEFSNMQIISATDNAKKAIKQNPSWETKISNMEKANAKRSKKVTIDGVDYLSIKEAARAIGCCSSTLGRAIKRYGKNRLKTTTRTIFQPD